MKKNLLAVLMVLVLATVTLSASSFAVGAEAGLGIERIKHTASTTPGETVLRYKNIGPALNVNVDYNFNEYWGVRANAGLNFFVNSSAKTNNEYKKITDSKTFVAFDLALDAKYTVRISNNLKLSALAGFEMLSGYVYKDEKVESNNDNLKNFSFGVNAAAELGYAINNNLTLKGGVSVGYFFVNTAKTLKATSDSYKVRNTTFYIRPYAGVLYTF